ncbi:MAG TPA: hypothetical protein VF240_02850 [Pyrinomonadaceae bacterium]
MGFLVPFFNFFINPKKVIQIDESKLKHLNEKSAHILFALAEAVIGEEFRVKVPKFVEMIDDYLGYQRRSQREALNQGLLIVESTIVTLVFGRRLRGFSHLSLPDRRRVLENMRQSRVQQFRNLYAAAVNISASAYFASEATWAEIMYAGVSVDHPEILTGPPPPVRWRPNDTRPVEP